MVKKKLTQKLRLLGLIAALSLSACVPSPAPGTLEPHPAANGLRVMTYNLLGAQADGVIFNEWAGWAARIDQLKPDVVVLQEAQGDDVSAIVGLTSGDYRLASYRTWECDTKPNPEGVAILVKSSIGTLDASGTHVGQSCVDPTVRRILVWADLDLDSGPFRVYGTHLTSGSGASALSRYAQISAIRSLIAGHDPEHAGRWIFAGDINESPHGFGYRLLLGDEPDDSGAGRFVDTFGEAHPNALLETVCPTVPSDAVSMAALLADPGHVRDCGYTAGWPKDSNYLGCDVLSFCDSWQQRQNLSVRERIDVVLRAQGGPVTVSATFVPNRSDSDWASPSAEWFRLSDHLPYVVGVELK